MPDGGRQMRDGEIPGVARSRHAPPAAAALLLIVMLGASVAFAQQIWSGGAGRYPAKWATESDFESSFVFCRMAFTSGRSLPSGRGWMTDYPGADINLSIRLSELTRTRVGFDAHRNPNHVVVELTDPLLFQCPMLFVTHYGEVRFSEAEVRNLREYFLKGGFLWADDAWGSPAWQYWVQEISRVLPPGDFPIIDIPATHPIMRTHLAVEAIPQVPSINFWWRNGGQTSELGADSAEVSVRGIEDSHGRLMVLMTHNTDIQDTWEREAESPEYFYQFSPVGYAIGINVVLYAMLH
jgi:hypothetical protein